MKTTVTEMFGNEFPIFAFSHCRDVVAAVSKAGGVGVLGAVGRANARYSLPDACPSLPPPAAMTTNWRPPAS